MNKKNHYINLFVLACMMVLAITSCQQELMPVQPEADSARTLTFTLNMPQGKPAFGEGESRAATTGTWAQGDELLMTLTADEYMKLFLTLQPDGNNTWQVVAEKSYTHFTQDNSYAPYSEMPMLTQTTGLSLSGGTWTVCADEAWPENLPMSVQLVYAPDMEFDAEGGLALKADATTSLPEYWEAASTENTDGTLSLQWTEPANARLRIYTGMAGDEVKLTSEAISAKFTRADHTYTATTQTDGYACFYCTMAEQTSGFTVELSAVRMGEGDAAVTCPLSCVTLLKASNVVPVTLESAKSYKLDATGQRIAWTKSVAVIDGTTENIETNIKDAIADGKTTLYVTGNDIENVKRGISGVRSGTVNLILPDAEKIGVEAFYECTALTSVNLPKATSIESRAFKNCNHLTSVNLPSATSIGYGAFDNCIALTNVNLPKVISITEYAFYGCSALTSVNLPKVKSISPHTFYGCSSLTSLTFGSVIEYVTSYAFSYASTEQCDLTLAVGQTEGDPDVVNRTWVSYTWKSITIK